MVALLVFILWRFSGNVIKNRARYGKLIINHLFTYIYTTN